MKTFSLILRDATSTECFEQATSFVSEDARQFWYPGQSCAHNVFPGLWFGAFSYR